MKNKFKENASKILKNQAQLQELLAKARAIGNKYEPLHAVKTDLETSYRLIQAWSTGDYKTIPWNSLIMLASGIIYIVNPVDVIPDFILGIGFLDDLAVIRMIFSAVKKDLDAFRAWEEALKDTIKVQD